METEGLCLCEKCGKEFSDSSRLSSHLCTVDFTKKGQLTRYKCPLCNEVFTMPGALKHHFQSHRREELTGPFHCSVEACQFSTSHRLVYQEHLHAQHALTLVSCTFRSCTLAFRTHSEMEGHWRIHMPFHCPRCDFVTAHAKQLSTHGVEHDRPLAAPEGDKVPTTTGQGGSSQSALETSSGRPRRARKRNPAYVSSSQEDDEDEEETQQHNIDNRAREEVQKDKTATNINENPSKDHIMAGMEHMYRTHICPECRRCFKMRSHLLEHLHLHFPDPSLQCPTCNHYFTSKSKLRIHMLRESGQKVHRCHLCDYASVERNSLHRHLASVHSNEVGGDIHPDVYPCPTCGQSFRQSQALKAHMKSHHTLRDSQPLACFQEGCSFKTSDRKELQRHAADVHGVKAVECRHHACNAIFGSPQDMEAHYRTHLAFHCSQCDFSCSNKSLFRQHKLQGHAGDEELTCNFCPFATFNPVEFQQHVGHFHANEKIHRCHQCSFVTAHKRVLRRHMLMHSGEKPHKCNLCDFRCRDETYLSKHMLIHSDDKNHMCSECGYVTKWKHYLNVHMRKHAGDLRCKQKRALNNHEKRGCLKPDEVQCEFCSFVAKSQKAMANHVLVHRKDKLSLLKKVKKSVLRCGHCPFTCKQERCMTQHVALKHEGARPHRCRFCPFSTTRRYRLYAHESLHTGMGRHSCDVCDQTFGAASKLRQHHKRVHDKQPSHFCTLCDFSSYSLNDVGRHTLRCHTGKLLHPCSQCEARFSSDTALKQHCSRKHLSPASVACKQCDFICGSQATLKVHQQKKHPQLDCATCQETFPTRKSLEEHQRTHLTQQCPLCPFATRKRQPLTQHLLDEHEDGPPEDKPLKCAICGFACRHQLVFEQHVRSHGGTRLYKCTDCQYSTRNKQKITWHIRIHTGEKPYHCEQCSYSCADPSRLKYHMRIHQEEKKYLCPECGYKCKWMSQLKYHMTKHTGDKPYACDECEYRTNRGDALRIHRETQHCDARTFICEKCGKGFKTRFLLKTHQRKHSEERPYVCGLCRRAFRWPAGLRHHYLTHTNQQPFMCRYCPYRAKQKFQVVKHLRGHHPDQPVEHGVAKDPHALSLTLQDARLGRPEEGAGEEGMEVIVPDGVEVLVQERVEVLVQERVEEVTEGQQGEE
ncbi:uncharacterized protein znf142 isoform 2-T2 [Salvelinus alpinus]